MSLQQCNQTDHFLCLQSLINSISYAVIVKMQHNQTCVWLGLFFGEHVLNLETPKQQCNDIYDIVTFKS